jgi:outer membrane lipoprotein SlyB
MNTKLTVFGMAFSCSLAMLIAGCSSSPEPIIDTKGVDMSVYEQDLAECRTYSEQVDTSSGVAKGAAAGGATGAAVGAIGGGSGTRGAGVGAVLGMAKSGSRSANEKTGVVKSCLRGRGYKVLN